MSDERDERIRARAQEIWEEEGRPEGKDTEHWYRAAREVAAEADSAETTDQPTPDILKTTTALR